jgi:hypothetical protein
MGFVQGVKGVASIDKVGTAGQEALVYTSRHKDGCLHDFHPLLFVQGSKQDVNALHMFDSPYIVYSP